MILRDDKNYIDYKTLLHLVICLIYEYSKCFIQPVVQQVKKCKRTFSQNINFTLRTAVHHDRRCYNVCKETEPQNLQNLMFFWRENRNNFPRLH